MSERYKYREEKLQEIYSRIRLLGEDTTPPFVPAQEIKRLIPDHEHIMTTDFVVSDVTNRKPIRSPGGVLLGFRFPETGIISIDHHFDDPEMWRPVSSTNLALQYRREMPQHTSVSPVYISHTDADSVLASGILAGYLALDDRFGEAAIAADHTGEENDIADLLMALDAKRDVALSMNALQKLLDGRPQSPDVQDLVDRRRAQRQRAHDIVRRNVFNEQSDGLLVAYIQESIPGEFFPPLLPSAKAVVIASPMSNNKWEIKVRAGKAFPEGHSLSSFGLPNWGGRWNAGSTKRDGGTSDPDAFIDQLEKRLLELS